MGLSKEILRPTETRTVFSPASASSSEIAPTKEARVKAIIRELSQMLFAESKKDEETGDQPQEKTPRKDGFEPFVNPQPSDNPLFINGYNGNFAQQMELNRKGIERVLEIAHLDGKVVLVSMPFSRTRSVDANPDGTVTGKRSLFFGEKIEEDEKENPYRKVVPTPQGWKIEINDGRIMEDLAEKRLYSEKREEVFIKKFNQLLNQGLFECIRKEKLTGIKDKYLIFKLISTVLLPILQLWPNFYLRVLSLESFIAPAVLIETNYVMINMTLKRVTRKLDNTWEYLMPPIEIDKVTRAWAFLSLKGRTLVKEVKTGK